MPVGDLPEPTEREEAMGWPAHLCGGPLYVDRPWHSLPGVIVGMEEAVARDLGIDEGDGEDHDWDSMTEENIRLRDLWAGVYASNRRHAERRGSRRKLTRGEAAAANLGARHIGRPAKAGMRVPVDKVAYDDPAEFRAAVVTQCRSELTQRCPFLDPERLRRMVETALDRSRLATAPTPVRGPELDPSWDPCWVPEMPTFTDMAEWAFLRSLPDYRTRSREPVVKAVEFLFFAEGLEWRGDELATARPLALASLAAGQEILLRGPAPWFVAAAIESEQKAIRHAMKNVAMERDVSAL